MEDQTEELIEVQRDLEAESRTLGADEYWKRMRQHREHGTEDVTGPALRAINRAVATVTLGIQQRMEYQLSHTTQPRYVRQLKDLIDGGTKPECLAYLTLRHAMSHISQDQRLVTVAGRIGTAVMEDWLIQQWKTADPDGWKMTQEQIKRHHHRGKSQGVIRRMRSQSDADLPERWSPQLRMQVGLWLVLTLIDSTGWFTTTRRRTTRNRQVRTFLPTEKFMAWLEAGHERLAALQPIRMPMVVPPVPWTNGFDGGYLSIEHTLVKTRNRQYLQDLPNHEIDLVLSALNAIQSTPWRINNSILDVAEALWMRRESIGTEGDESLPPPDPEEVPAIPAKWEGKVKEWRETDYDGYKTWAQRASAIHERNHRNASKRVSAAEAIGVARRFSQWERIYFPHQLDFRGRAYPLPIHLHPQGPDLVRGMLEFADPKPLGKDGAYWLRVHAANRFGHDKVSFDERVQWVEDHREAIQDSAIDPLDGERFWTEADDPFQFLAACFELTGYWIEGEDYESRLPVAMDGSCNGLQNFSALLRDEVGGAATNLVPADQPADIYSEVATVVENQVAEDAAAGEPKAAVWDALVNRKLVKQPVMTLPYGATRVGMRRMIEAAIRKAGNPAGIRTRDMWSYCGYLADVTYDSIGQVVIAARQAMDWLQEVAKICADEEKVITWTTPLGLPVEQAYYKLDSKEVWVYIAGKKTSVRCTEDTEKLNKRRQASGISPNFIHSLDASHMMRTALYMYHYGIAHMGMIHDSFSCHASEVSLMNAAIRQAFVDQYSEPVIERFRDEIAGQLDDPERLPDLPEYGNLDINCVLNSDYFFA